MGEGGEDLLAGSHEGPGAAYRVLDLSWWQWAGGEGTAWGQISKAAQVNRFPHDRRRSREGSQRVPHACPCPEERHLHFALYTCRPPALTPDDLRVEGGPAGYWPEQGPEGGWGLALVGKVQPRTEQGPGRGPSFCRKPSWLRHCMNPASFYLGRLLFLSVSRWTAGQVSGSNAFLCWCSCTLSPRGSCVGGLVTRVTWNLSKV